MPDAIPMETAALVKLSELCLLLNIIWKIELIQTAPIIKYCGIRKTITVNSCACLKMFPHIQVLIDLQILRKAIQPGEMFHLQNTRAYLI